MTGKHCLLVTLSVLSLAGCFRQATGGDDGDSDDKLDTTSRGDGNTETGAAVATDRGAGAHRDTDTHSEIVTGGDASTHGGMVEDSDTGSVADTGGDGAGDPTGDSADNTGWLREMEKSTDICEELGADVTALLMTEVLLVLDRSFDTDDDDAWIPMGDVIRNLVARTESQINYGLMVYPSSSNDTCSTGDIVVPIGEKNGETIGRLVGGGDDDMGVALGTPIAASLAVAKNYLDTLDMGPPKAVLLLSNGAPTCNSTLDPAACVCTSVRDDEEEQECSSSERCLDDQNAIISAAFLVEVGYPVFVATLNPKMDWIDVMDTIAAAGGTGRHMPADSDELTDALTPIMSASISCEIGIPWDTLAEYTDRDPDRVNVYCEQTGANENNNTLAIPRDDDCAMKQGWTWIDDKASAIRFCEHSCELIKTRHCNQISVTFPCE